jgi:hypothetical protein
LFTSSTASEVKEKLISFLIEASWYHQAYSPRIVALACRAHRVLHMRYHLHVTVVTKKYGFGKEAIVKPCKPLHL